MIKNPHVDECLLILKNRLEKGISVKLLDGSIRTGYVYAVDPQVPCALILVKVVVSNFQPQLSNELIFLYHRHRVLKNAVKIGE